MSHAASSGSPELVSDSTHIRMIGSAYRKTGRPVVLVPLGTHFHAGQQAVLAAAGRIPRGIVIVALADNSPLWPQAAEVFAGSPAHYLWRYQPAERTTRVLPADHGLEDPQQLSETLTQVLALAGALGPSDVFYGERDYELLLALSTAIHDLQLPIKVTGVPTVRLPGGLPLSQDTLGLDASAREAGLALSAALIAGAHSAEAGPAAIVAAAREVLSAAGIDPHYLKLRSRQLGPAPSSGEGRLLVAATVGNVRLRDNVGVPIGIGFRNLGAQD